MRIIKTLLLTVSIAMVGMPRAMAASDTSGPSGTWYLLVGGTWSGVTHATGGARVVATISGGSGTVRDEGSNTVDAIQQVSWNSSTRELEFRRLGATNQWYRGRVAEGVFVGRVAPSTSPVRPSDASFRTHATGWNETNFDNWNRDNLGSAIAPRVFNIVINDNYRATLRIDRSGSWFTGRMKITSRSGYTCSGPRQDAVGQEPEDDVQINNWDGRNLLWTRPPGATSAFPQVYAGTVVGRDISGNFANNGSFGGTFVGKRAQVLSYGVEPKSDEARAAWQERVRRQLDLLMRGNNPTSAGTASLAYRPTFSDTAGWRQRDNDIAPRNDNPQGHPQDYMMFRVALNNSIPSLLTPQVVARNTYGYVMVPYGPAPEGGFPAMISLNGHLPRWQVNSDRAVAEHWPAGSWPTNAPEATVHPGEWYWYADSFARRGYVVLTIDIGHRDGWNADGMPARPPVSTDVLAATDSDWEQDGERAWDVSKGVDFLYQQSYVDRNRVAVVGVSMGAEVAQLAAGLDPRIALAISGQAITDIEVQRQTNNHDCWHWNNAEAGEYVDFSDHLALIAPRYAMVQTGVLDVTFGRTLSGGSCVPDRRNNLMNAKQATRRALSAFNSDSDNFIHYLVYNSAHDYSDGDIAAPTSNPTLAGQSPWSSIHASTIGSVPRLVTSSARLRPAFAGDQGWQSSDTTSVSGSTVHEWARYVLGSNCEHSMCVAGEALEPSCNPCVQKVVQADSYCGTVYWDEICSDEVSTVCKRTCQ